MENMSGNRDQKLRFECCLDEYNQVQSMRSVQGHSGREHINPRLQNNVLVPCGWSDHLHHMGSTYDYRSMCEGGLTAGGHGFREGRQTCFFAAVDPVVATMLTPRYEDNEPRTKSRRLKWGPMPIAVYGFDLRLAQNKRIGILAFHQKYNNTV